jgi:divalent metal cation (Fe/Co/Zn/Cd) transporter
MHSHGSVNLRARWWHRRTSGLANGLRIVSAGSGCQFNWEQFAALLTLILGNMSKTTIKRRPETFSFV